MKNETDLQKEIIDRWRELGSSYWGRKLSNAYISGVPDLLLSGGGGPFLIEVKKITKIPARNDTRITFDHPLTAIQNKTLMDLRRGGTQAAWWAIHRNSKEDVFYVGWTDDDRPTTGEFIQKCLVRNRRDLGAWPKMFMNLIQWTIQGQRIDY